jgi:O-antigen/teichoic acid export membrane protein
MSDEPSAAMSAASNARWVGSIQLARVCVQLLSLLFLSRMLAPDDFGLVAMASVVTNFAILLRDLGTSAAVIQRPQLDEGTLDTAFWMTCSMGLVLGIAVLVASPIVAAVMQAPRLQGVLLALAVVFPISSMTIVHQALFERSGRFAIVARIEIGSVLVGFAVALVAASLGAGPYSLVLQTIAIACLTTLQLYFASSWRPRRSWDVRQFRELWRFGGQLSGFNIINYFARNADSMIIGRVLGAASLGAYSLAYRIMLFPLYNLTFVATRALLPVMSRRQASSEQLAGLYLRTLSVIAFFTAPLMTGLFVLRKPFVDVLLGERWAVVIEIVAWLAPVGFIQSLVSPSGSVFTALGRADIQLKFGAVAALTHVLSFVIGVQWGLVGLARCYFFANVATAIATTVLTMRVLKQSPWRVAEALHRPIAIALLMGACVHVASAELADSLSPTLQLACFAGGGAFVYFVVARFAASTLEREVRRILLKRA